MNHINVKKHFFVVEEKSTQKKFRVKMKEVCEDGLTSFDLNDMQIIEGKSFISEEYLHVILLEIALMYSGIGSTDKMMSTDDIVFHFDIAR